MKLLVEEDGSEVVEQAAGQTEVVAALLLAYDAVQLAGALEVAAADDELRFACWDGDLRNAARDEGLAVLPAQP